MLFETDAGFRQRLRIAGLVSLLLLPVLIIGLGNAWFGWSPFVNRASNQPVALGEKPRGEPVLLQAATPLPPPQAVTLSATWPSGFAAGRSVGEAFIDLAARWGVILPAGEKDPCQFVESVGLRCLSRQDSLVQLRNLNRPAILTLYDDNGKPFHALLAGLDGQRARFVVGREVHELDVAVLESRWFGEFQLLWKPPVFYAASSMPGSSGPAVPWLASSLETLGLYTRNGTEVRLEGQLLGALKRYQLAAGLVPDGQLGPMTLIRLLNTIDHEEPLLRPAEEGS